MKKQNLKKGFTIVEMLMAISIFVVIATISTSILIRTVNMEKLTDIRNTMLDDARVFMEQLTSLINNGAIDYEEYYSINVVQGAKTDPTKIAYGVYYGAYGSRFYSAGDAAFRGGKMITPTINPDHLGVDCAVPLVPPMQVGDTAAPQYCEVTYTDSKDKNEGQNPYNDPSLSDKANAFCDEKLMPCADISDNFTADELYIITDMMNDEEKIQKYIIATQPNGNEDYIAVASIMNGLDVDENNIMDLFRCEDEGPPCHESKNNSDPDVENFYKNYPQDFNPDDFDPGRRGPLAAYKYSLPFKADHTGNFSVNQSSFFPITPFRTSVKNLKFIISPPDDPYKAYNEKNMKMHPTVTILLTVEPSSADKARYPGGWKDEYTVTIQRTVTAGIEEIGSFPPTYDLTWICEILGGTNCPDYIYPPI